MTDVLLSLNVLNGGKDTYFPSDRLSGQMKAKGKTHMCFPQRPLIQPGVSLLAVPAIPDLTLAMPAVIALLAPLLVHHRVATTLGAQVPCDAHMAHAQWAGCLDAICMISLLAIGDVRVGACLLLRLLLLHLVEVHLQCLCHRIGERTYLLHAKADRTTAANAAQLISDLPGTVSL